MVDQRLINYIKSELSRGTSLNKIKQRLLSQGWSNYDINNAISLATQQKTFPTIPTSSLSSYEESVKKSKFWIILVLGVVIIGGAFTFFMLTEKEASKTTVPTTKPTQTPTTPIGPIDCGTDIDCLITASQNCKPAKVNYTSTINMFGMLIVTTTFYEIKGTEANKCILYLRTEKQDINFSEELVQQMLTGGATQEQIQQQKQEANRQTELIEGRDGICKFNSNADLTSLLNKWKKGTFSGSVSCNLVGGEWECTSTGDWAVADCEGEMFISQVSQ